MPDPLIGYRDALHLTLDACVRLDVVSVALADALGRELREDVAAGRDHPPFDRVTMDGVALRAADAAPGARLPVAGEAAAGAREPPRVRRGTCVRVMTGAPLPPGADCVIPVERLSDDGDHVVLSATAADRTVGQHVAPRGAAARAGELLVTAGATLGPAAIAAAAGEGYATLRVTARPRVVLVATGDEIVPLDATPGPHQIRASSVHAMAAMARRVGVRSARVLHAPDRRGALARVLEAALSADLVVTTGGVSVGRYDLVPEVLTGLGVRPLFHGVAQRPGRPLWVGRHDGGLVIGAPGNPADALVTFALFARPALAAMAGSAPPAARAGTLVEDVAADDVLTRHVALSVAPGDDGGEPRLRPVSRHAAPPSPWTAATGITTVPPGGGIVPGGSRVSFVSLV